MDYYSILGIPRNASQDDIRKAYKKQSMQHHPDRGGDENQFKKVNEAYSTLKDPDKRQQYDNPRPQFNQHQHWHTGNFEDLFRRQRPRNRDITIAARVDLKDVFTGKSLIANYRLNSGRTETVTIDVPVGVRNNDTIRFRDLGDDSFPGPRGNLLVKIQIIEPKKFAHEGQTLYQEVDINAIDMITGITYNVQTLDEKSLSIKVPQGTQAGTKFKIPGYGLPKLHDSKNRGDLIIVANSYIPTVKDHNLLKKLKKIKNNIDRTQ